MFRNVGVFSSQTFSRINTPTFLTPFILHTYPPMKMEQNVPKRRCIKFRRRGITQKKAYNIQNTAKVWNQFLCFQPFSSSLGNHNDANACKGSVNLKSFRPRQLSELNLQRHFQVMYECIISNFVLRSSYVTHYQCVPHRRSASCSRKKSKAVHECQKVADPYNKQSIRNRTGMHGFGGNLYGKSSATLSSL